MILRLILNNVPRFEHALVLFAARRYLPGVYWAARAVGAHHRLGEVFNFKFHQPRPQGEFLCLRSPQKTEPRFITKTGAKDSPSHSATAGRSRRTTGMDRCCI